MYLGFSVTSGSGFGDSVAVIVSSGLAPASFAVSAAVPAVAFSLFLRLIYFVFV